MSALPALGTGITLINFASSTLEAYTHTLLFSVIPDERPPESGSTYPDTRNPCPPADAPMTPQPDKRLDTQDDAEE